ncbi:hypothetical protein KFK09_009710 [Dendrobium nobile]|uniref:Reverse transcriptase zinc-binding domain-containing protein n=1 Tax=Dendrobium nobile TaxID=94219 RepID=A0A8T3BIA0_DENNO|nr:hypothetical protein KFK09_009710 [Dendrobium nobile]
MEIKSCITFSVSAYSNLSFTWDPWCGGSSIADYLHNQNSLSIIPSISHWNISQFIRGTSWDLPNGLDDCLVSLINSVTIDEQQENHCWKDKQNLKFSDFNSHFYATLPLVNWYKYIWHKKSAIRYSVYAWMAFRGGLKTTDVLAVRGIIVPNTCCFCNTEKETISHLFFECHYTFGIAIALLPWMHRMFMRPNIHQLYDTIWEQGFPTNTRNYYLLIASSMVYFVWRARNDRLFGGIIDCKATTIAKIRKAISIKTHGWKI